MNFKKALLTALLLSFTLTACNDSRTSFNHSNNTQQADTQLQDVFNDTSEDTLDTNPTEDTSPQDTSPPQDTSEDTELPPESQDPTGILDLTFAPDAPTPGIFTGPVHTRSDGSGLAIAPSGDIFVAGRGRLTPENEPADYPKQFTLHLSNTGTPVPEFGENGLATMAFGPESQDIFVLQSTLQSDQKTITCGNIRSTQMGRAQLVVTRQNPDGTPDPTFGNTLEYPGIAYFDVPTDKPNSLCWALQILPDHKILVAGQIGANSTMIPLLMRLNPDGSLDPTFGNATPDSENSPGITLHDIAPTDKMLYAHIRQITTLPNHQILALVHSLHLQTGHQNGHLLRFHPDGKLDTTFGTNGLITLELPNQTSHEVFDFTSDLTTQRVYITGKIKNNDPDIPFLAFVHALTTDGQPAPEFPTFILSDLHAATRSILIQPDGKIVATGSSVTHSNPDFEAGDLLAIRLTPDGQLDPHFATNGIFTHHVPTLLFYAARAQLDPQNRLVITGSTPLDGEQSPRGHTFVTRLR